MNLLVLFIFTSFFTSYCILFWKKVSLISSLVTHKISYEQSYHQAKGLLSYAKAYIYAHKDTLFKKEDTVIILFDRWPEDAADAKTVCSGKLIVKKDVQSYLIIAELLTLDKKVVHTLHATVLL